MKKGINVDELRGLDLVKDEYSNYYFVMTVESMGWEIKKIVLCHTHHYWSFSNFKDQIEGEYDYIGKILVDNLNHGLKIYKESNKRIFTIEELIKANIDVLFYDITKYSRESLKG